MPWKMRANLYIHFFSLLYPPSLVALFLFCRRWLLLCGSKWPSLASPICGNKWTSQENIIIFDVSVFPLFWWRWDADRAHGRFAFCRFTSQFLFLFFFLYVSLNFFLLFATICCCCCCCCLLWERNDAANKSFCQPKTNSSPSTRSPLSTLRNGSKLKYVRLE